MKAFVQIIKNTWSEYMMYRANFVLWRVRMVLQMVITYSLWWALFSMERTLFGYSQQQMLTYVVFGSLVRTTVLGTTTMDVGSMIHRGDLSNFLVRPMSFFRYFIARDIGDKCLNIAFAIGELALFLLLVRPPIVFQLNISYVLYAILAAGIGTAVYFSFSMLMGFLGFWSPDVWAPRFISMVVIEFFAGGLFPLDILPRPLYFVSQLLPFQYFLYVPMKIYLGTLPMMAILLSLSIGIFWAVVLALVANVVWKSGLRAYTAQGR